MSDRTVNEHREVNRHSIRNGTKELIKGRLRRGYYSKVLSELVERNLAPTYDSRITASQLYQITSKYAALFKETVHQPADRTWNIGRSSYPEQVIYRKENQERYVQDQWLKGGYHQQNLRSLYVLILYSTKGIMDGRFSLTRFEYLPRVARSTRCFVIANNPKLPILASLMSSSDSTISNLHIAIFLHHVLEREMKPTQATKFQVSFVRSADPADAAPITDQTAQSALEFRHKDLES